MSFNLRLLVRLAWFTCAVSLFLVNERHPIQFVDAYTCCSCREEVSEDINDASSVTIADSERVPVEIPTEASDFKSQVNNSSYRPDAKLSTNTLVSNQSLRRSRSENPENKNRDFKLITCKWGSGSFIDVELIYRLAADITGLAKPNSGAVVTIMTQKEFNDFAREHGEEAAFAQDVEAFGRKNVRSGVVIATGRIVNPEKRDEILRINKAISFINKENLKTDRGVTKTNLQNATIADKLIPMEMPRSMYPCDKYRLAVLFQSLANALRTKRLHDKINFESGVFASAASSYILPRDYQKIEQAFANGKHLLAKPSAGSEGRGITLVRNIGEMRSVLGKIDSAGSTKGKRKSDFHFNGTPVMCEFIDNTKLLKSLPSPEAHLNNHKFDFRVYAFVFQSHENNLNRAECQVSPSSRIFLYKEGLTRFSCKEYINPKDISAASLKDDDITSPDFLLSILTNTSLVSASRTSTEVADKAVASDEDFQDVGKSEGTENKSEEKCFKYKMTTILDKIAAEDPTFDSEAFWSQVAFSIKQHAETVLSVSTLTYMLEKQVQTEHNEYDIIWPEASAQVFGYDFMLDSDNKVHFIECNYRPSFKFSSIMHPREYLFKPQDNVICATKQKNPYEHCACCVMNKSDSKDGNNGRIIPCGSCDEEKSLDFKNLVGSVTCCHDCFAYRKNLKRKAFFPRPIHYHTVRADAGAVDVEVKGCLLVHVLGELKRQFSCDGEDVALEKLRERSCPALVELDGKVGRMCADEETRATGIVSTASSAGMLADDNPQDRKPRVLLRYATTLLARMKNFDNTAMKKGIATISRRRRDTLLPKDSRNFLDRNFSVSVAAIDEILMKPLIKHLRSENAKVTSTSPIVEKVSKLEALLNDDGFVTNKLWRLLSTKEILKRTTSISREDKAKGSFWPRMLIVKIEAYYLNNHLFQDLAINALTGMLDLLAELATLAGLENGFEVAEIVMGEK